LKRFPIRYVIFPTLLAGIGIALLLQLPAGWSVGWRAELLNRTHVPLMAVFCVALVGFFRTNIRTVLGVAISAIIFAALVELVQPWFHRTADMGDFIWGIVGIAFGSFWNAAKMLQSQRICVLIRVLAIACMFWPPLEYVSEVMRAKLAAERLFPVLTNFTGVLESFFWSVEPSGQSNIRQLKEGGEMILVKSGQLPASARLDAQNNDWSQFDGLAIDGTLEAPTAIEVGLRLDLNISSDPRLRAGKLMQPGRHQIQIWWPRLTPPRSVHQMVVFLAAGEPAARLRIHRMHLVKRMDAATPE
jgi:hypothetical protein